MTPTRISKAHQQFIDDEMLRAPMLFDQMLEGTLEHMRRSLPTAAPLLLNLAADLRQALQAHQARLAEYFMRSLRDRVDAELRQKAPELPSKANAPLSLALVDEDEVALDVQLSHTIEAIRSTAEYELRELQTFTSALAGDMDMARDHNPFGAEAYARALWAAAQALPMSRGHQVEFMRHAGPTLAQILRKAYAASASRLDAQGVEPAAYRTLILPPGSRRDRPGETTYSPDLHGMREQYALHTNSGLSFHGQSDHPPRLTPAPDLMTDTLSTAERQSLELVSRLFEAIVGDPRVPPDVLTLIARLHGPAMRLSLRDGSMLDQDTHPLWTFINRLAYAAEMSPDTSDPERTQLLKLAHSTINQLGREPEQTPSLYRWALEQLENFLERRLIRRCSAVASQIGALQKLEDKLCFGQTQPSTLHGTIDVPHLETVPAELMPDTATGLPAPDHGEVWVDSVQPGEWLRLFMQGRWIHAQLLWPGDRREIWLLGDGASDTTWAVRRRALVTLHQARLIKPLKQRSLIRRAAQTVQELMASNPA